jgi:hypothetical protein
MSELLRYAIRTRGDSYTAGMHTVTSGLSRSSRSSSGSDLMPAVEMHLERRSTLTSVYVAKEKVHNRPEGAVTKIIYSRQDLNGSEFAHLLFTGERVTMQWFSPRTPDIRSTAALQANNSLPEDALFLWARRSAYPYLARGKPFPITMLRSISSDKLETFETTLLFEEKPQVVKVPAGSITANVFRGAGTTFFVERPEPQRIFKWESRGETAELLAD